MEEDKNTTFFKNNLVTNYPDIAKITFTPISKKYLKVLLINFCLLSIVLFALVFGVTQIESKKFDIENYSLYLYIGLIVILLINLILIFLEFNQRKYAVREEDITYKKGLLLSKLITVPYNRVQHLNITESFFERNFKLASLHIFTAGDDDSDLVIKGLPQKQAYEIREHILQKIKNL